MIANHKSNLGIFGDHLPSDIDGYVPTAECGPWELNYDHGSERTHDEAGELTAYGEWWRDDRWPEIVAEAVAATDAANAAASEWKGA